jgi:anti-sigma B factor antagonist
MPEACFPVEVADGVPVVTAPEEIDITNAAALRAALASAAGLGNVLLVVDMSGTRFCDSSGVNALVCALKNAQANGGTVKLVMSADVLRIFAIIGVDRMIPHFPTLDQALGRAPGVTVHPPVPAP